MPFHGRILTPVFAIPVPGWLYVTGYIVTMLLLLYVLCCRLYGQYYRRRNNSKPYIVGIEWEQTYDRDPVDIDLIAIAVDDEGQVFTANAMQWVVGYFGFRSMSNGAIRLFDGSDYERGINNEAIKVATDALPRGVAAVVIVGAIYQHDGQIVTFGKIGTLLTGLYPDMTNGSEYDFTPIYPYTAASLVTIRRQCKHRVGLFSRRPWHTCDWRAELDTSVKSHTLKDLLGTFGITTR